MRIRAERLGVRFDAVQALHGVNLDVSSGERRAVIGPNGAGKTTLFNAITGELRPSEGKVWLDSLDVSGLPAWRRARMGLARTFQRSTLFSDLSAAENLAQAVRARERSQWRFWPGRERALRAEVAERLELAGLADRAHRPARTLSHGEQRALEIEIALTARARALMLDEPMAGLSGAERAAAVVRLRSLPPEVTLLVVEHDLDAVFTLAERVTVLDQGLVIADGSGAEVREDARVQEVYLGAR